MICSLNDYFTKLSSIMTALRIKEWPIVLKEIYRVTKPNGLVQLLEAVGQYVTTDPDALDFNQKGKLAECWARSGLFFFFSFLWFYFIIYLFFIIYFICFLREFDWSPRFFLYFFFTDSTLCTGGAWAGSSIGWETTQAFGRGWFHCHSAREAERSNG